MVIPDWSARPRPKPTEILFATPELRLSHPRDRLAAAIVDFSVILAPIHILLSAPLKRALMTSFILNAELEMYAEITAMVMLAVALVVLYQTVAIYKFGTTFGKRLFGLSVVPVFKDQPLTRWAAFCRAASWVGEILLFGLPWLAVFSDPLRRPFHDRIGNTAVVTRSPLGAPAPSVIERRLSAVGFGAAVVVLMLLLCVQVAGTYRALAFERAFAANVSPACDAIDQAVGEAGDDPHARAKLALALFSAGLVERTCLNDEIEHERHERTPANAMTYLLQSFVNAEDVELSNSYLDQVCVDGSQSVECAMSHLVAAWSDDDIGGVEKIISQAPKGSGYLEVWAVRHFMKQADYGAANRTLDDLAGHRELADFVTNQRVKALFNGYHQPEADAALAQAVMTLPEDQAKLLSAWTCAQELQNGCAALSNLSCRTIGGDNKNDGSAASLALLMTNECKGAVDYTALMDDSEDATWNTFLHANLKREKRDFAAAEGLLTKVIRDDDAADVLRVEAARRLLQSSSTKTLANAVEVWRGIESREAWMKIGNMLASRLAQRHEGALALNVKDDLDHAHALSPQASVLLALMTTASRTARVPAAAQEEPTPYQEVDSARELLRLMKEEE